jgi:hypothetical protein
MMVAVVLARISVTLMCMLTLLLTRGSSSDSDDTVRVGLC